MKQKVLITFVVIGVLVAITFGLVKAVQPRPLEFQGQVEAREVDVAAKVAGRILRILVREGDHVALGDLLFELDSPELNAKLVQAEASREAAVALLDKADSGAREEEVRTAKFEWASAQAASDLAMSTFERFDTLFQEGLIAEQKYDEVATSRKAASDAARAARAQYDMAVNGARAEDIAAATALVGETDGVIAEVSADLRETRLKAPVAGEVSSVLVEVGELAPTGFPVITLVDLNDTWVVLNVREDHLVKFQMDSTVTGSIPALGDRRVEFSVYYIAPLADFATWRATRYSSGYDIKTFEIRLRSTEAVEGLRPGMSVLIEH